MNNNLDFLNKTEINSFVYTTANNDRLQEGKNVVIDGREYTKWGYEQIVTFVGMMYETKNKDTDRTDRFITIGVSKQHPADIRHNKRVAIEVARTNAIIDPIMTMYNVSENFNNYSFKQMMDAYVSTMELDFVMTTEEKKKYERMQFNKDWNFYLNNRAV